MPAALAAEATPIIVPPAPAARTGSATENYFGKVLRDPYRWMENKEDPDWLPFLKAQNDRTRAVLDALPGRPALAARIAQLSGDTATTRSVQRAGGRLSFQQRPPGADNFKLFVRQGGRDRMLVGPTALNGPAALGGAGGHVSLDW